MAPDANVVCFLLFRSLGPYKALSGFIKPSRGPHEALQGRIRPLGPYKAIKACFWETWDYFREFWDVFKALFLLERPCFG